MPQTAQGALLAALGGHQKLLRIGPRSPEPQDHIKDGSRRQRESTARALAERASGTVSATVGPLSRATPARTRTPHSRLLGAAVLLASNAARSR